MDAALDWIVDGGETLALLPFAPFAHQSLIRTEFKPLIAWSDDDEVPFLSPLSWDL